MSELHHDVVAGWEGAGAGVYERARPGYPAAVGELIGTGFGVGPGTRILDLAAGTGKLTRELTGLGAEVIAVEPVAHMREQLTAAVDGVEVLEGTAERIPVGDGTIRVVTVAQAFHWFDVPRATAEIHRVLEPGGGLAVLRNDWGEQPGGWLPELLSVLHAHSPRDGQDGDHGNAWTEPFSQTGLFGPLTTRVFDNPLSSDLTGLQDRLASISYVGAMEQADRQALLDEVAAILARHGISGTEPFPIPNVTVMRWAHRR